MHSTQIVDPHILQGQQVVVDGHLERVEFLELVDAAPEQQSSRDHVNEEWTVGFVVFLAVCCTVPNAGSQLVQVVEVIIVVHRILLHAIARYRQQFEPLVKFVLETGVQEDLLHLQTDGHSILRAPSEVPELLHRLQNFYGQHLVRLSGFPHNAKCVAEVLVQVEFDVVPHHLWFIVQPEKAGGKDVSIGGYELLEVVKVAAACDAVEDEIARENRKRDLFSSKRQQEWDQPPGLVVQVLRVDVQLEQFGIVGHSIQIDG